MRKIILLFLTIFSIGCTLEDTVVDTKPNTKYIALGYDEVDSAESVINKFDVTYYYIDTITTELYLDSLYFTPIDFIVSNDTISVVHSMYLIKSNKNYTP